MYPAGLGDLGVLYRKNSKTAGLEGAGTRDNANQRRAVERENCQAGERARCAAECQICLALSERHAGVGGGYRVGANHARPG